MGSSPSPALGLILRPPPNPGGVYLSCVSLSTSQNPSFVSSSVVSSSQRIWVGSKGPSLFRSSLNSMNWVTSFSLSLFTFIRSFLSAFGRLLC